MSKIKHKFSKYLILPDGSQESFEASEADSWDEARKEVEKGVYDRMLELKTTKQSMSVPEVPSTPNGSTEKNPSDVSGLTAAKVIPSNPPPTSNTTNSPQK